jgi:hypothetical protein
MTTVFSLQPIPTIHAFQSDALPSWSEPEDAPMSTDGETLPPAASCFNLETFPPTAGQLAALEGVNREREQAGRPKLEPISEQELREIEQAQAELNAWGHFKIPTKCLKPAAESEPSDPQDCKESAAPIASAPADPKAPPTRVFGRSQPVNAGTPAANGASAHVWAPSNHVFGSSQASAAADTPTPTGR